MKKKIIIAALAITCAMAANAQGYTTLGVGVNPPQATLHVHSDSVVSSGGGPGGSGVTPNPGNGPRDRTDPIFQNNYITTIKMTNGNTASGGFTIKQDNLGIALIQNEEASFRLGTAAGTAVVIEPGGNVGIGLGSDEYGFCVAKTSLFTQPVVVTKTLDVDQTLHANGGLSVTGMFSVGTAMTVMGSSTSIGTLHVSGSQSIGGGLGVGGNQTTQGNLTVGGALTVGDGFVCDSAGNMKVKHLRVTTTDWPDYVFGKAYRLMPLHEVETYVNKEGHLPEIPAASEIETDGVDQGEMNKMLLQKVEELTLYIIDLRKQIEELKNK